MSDVKIITLTPRSWNSGSWLKTKGIQTNQHVQHTDIVNLF